MNGNSSKGQTGRFGMNTKAEVIASYKRSLAENTRKGAKANVSRAKLRKRIAELEAEDK